MTTPARPHLRWVTGGRAIARERRLTLAIAVGAFAIALPVAYDSLRAALESLAAGALAAAAGDLGLVVIATLLGYASLVYFLTRIGHLARLAAPGTDEAVPDEPAAGRLVALVPSYREDPHVVTRAVISAALQSHPDRRVVLLIDDPPGTDPSVTATRAIPWRVQGMLGPMRERCETARRRFEERAGGGTVDVAAEAAALAAACREVADWFESHASRYGTPDPADRFFAQLIFGVPASRWRGEAARWEEAARGAGPAPELETLRAAYARLATVFRVEITSFERKRYANLSHAANKAMNINSYLALLGGSYRCDPADRGVVLTPCAPGAADLTIPDADFALVLDADTIIAPDYTRTLLPRFRGPEGERLAVVQCPYSTIPGDGGLLQRIAGAQTDIQYLVHQGLTHYNATYWVGANALVRIAALRDVAVREVEDGVEVIKFIRDRTLIEDTESTIDLVARGWRLLNHPERLAFSMTPTDFGALLIQRRRWANGGVLIVPKLLASMRRRGRLADRLVEGFMRFHYLISLGPVSIALLVALSVVWDKDIRTAGLFCTGLAYNVIYARDLHLVGYRWHDILRVVALNLVLIPVNIMGMLSSLAQGVTGRKPRFARTPKVRDRTRVPVRYVVAEFALLLLWAVSAASGLVRGRLVVGAVMLLHTVFLAYAIRVFLGYRDSVDDLAVGLGLRRAPHAGAQFDPPLAPPPVALSMGSGIPAGLLSPPSRSCSVGGVSLPQGESGRGG